MATPTHNEQGSPRFTPWSWQQSEANDGLTHPSLSGGCGLTKLWVWSQSYLFLQYSGSYLKPHPPHVEIM